ncbi:MAG: CHRD domain-containing protein [Paludibacter sp.]|nr:CHRD domain-containing protein [Paludibacter sp.]
MKKNKFSYLILSALAYFTISLIVSCKNADSETPYKDHGISIFKGYADATQAGFDTTANVLSTSRATFIAYLDNNSKVFTVNISWKGLTSDAKAAFIYAPADSAVFLTEKPSWQMTNSLSGTSGSGSFYRMEATQLTDNEVSALMDTTWNHSRRDSVGVNTKWYFVINTTNHGSTTANGVGEVRGQVKYQRTFYKN